MYLHTKIDVVWSVDNLMCKNTKQSIHLQKTTWGNKDLYFLTVTSTFQPTGWLYITSQQTLSVVLSLPKEINLMVLSELLILIFYTQTCSYCRSGWRGDAGRKYYCSTTSSTKAGQNRCHTLILSALFRECWESDEKGELSFSWVSQNQSSELSEREIDTAIQCT